MRTTFHSSFLFLFFLLLAHIADALLSVETGTSLQLSILDRLSSSFQESSLLELKLTLYLLALDIWDEERGDEVLNDDLRLVALLLDVVKEVVNLAHLELSLLIGLDGRSVVHSLHDHRL